MNKICLEPIGLKCGVLFTDNIEFTPTFMNVKGKDITEKDISICINTLYDSDEEKTINLTTLKEIVKILDNTLDEMKQERCAESNFEMLLKEYHRISECIKL